jgi:Ca-activated chloride channel family protein
MFAKRFLPRLNHSFTLGILAGLSVTILWGCFSAGVPNVESPEAAETVLLETVLPNLSIEEDFVEDAVASRYTTDTITEPLPAIDDFPLYGATPPNNAEAVYLEIFSSSEKANVDKENERWLVEVAETFNNQGFTTANGQPIQVGIRQIPSGTAARLLAAGTVQPAAYSPSNDLWVKIINYQGIPTIPVQERLVPNTAGLVLQADAYEALGVT